MARPFSLYAYKYPTYCLTRSIFLDLWIYRGNFQKKLTRADIKMQHGYTVGESLQSEHNLHKKMGCTMTGKQVMQPKTALEYRYFLLYVPDSGQATLFHMLWIYSIADL
ncbi:hypothetical protein EWY72_23345 [Salmonella enterica subsp. enterica serovar Napoli]|nr:hypothetical protein [Salmonella enterica subsp. enterica serovar Napoli]